MTIKLCNYEIFFFRSYRKPNFYYAFKVVFNASSAYTTINKAMHKFNNDIK